jgi:cytochrome bd ubiquinol oxidase subunit I
VSAESLARWQFAITTVYHFLIVPLSIGLTVLVASFQTAHYRTKKPEWDAAARFYGKLMIVAFAIGVATGIVQEFQFGMNWSEYSRFVGDIFGAPLAMEGLVAFFLESTFLGLWVFGRGRLSPRQHLATIWLLATGTVMSAYFILAANSWMQHPVGWEFNPETGRAELTSIWALLTNSTQLVTFPHTVFAAFMTAGAVVLGISAWHLRKGPSVGGTTDHPDAEMHQTMHRKLAGVSAAVVAVSFLAVGAVGHAQGQVMTEQQPMKMAAAEALWHTTEGAPFSLFHVGDEKSRTERFDVGIPNGLSFLATNSPNGTVEGINDLQAKAVAEHGEGSYVPVVWLAYWSFRLMIGFGAVSFLLAAAVLWQRRRGRLESSTRLLRWAAWGAVLPFLANTAGWIFTETARQPWIVFGVLKTEDAISPGVSALEVGGTLVGSTLLYALLGVVALRLFLKIGRQGPAGTPPTDDDPWLHPSHQPAVPAQRADSDAAPEPSLVD